MSIAILVVFGLVYLGMALGRIPGLMLDRTGVALLGAIAMVALGALPIDDAWLAVDMPTLYLLFALMVVSAQFRLAGFYSGVVRKVVALRIGEPALLAVAMAVAGGLSAVLTNDVVCLAMTPMLIEGCARRRSDPVPYLLGLACASNIGSAATLIGNPQNILIGQRLSLDFGLFLLDAGVPALLGLVAAWAIIAWQYRGRGHQDASAAAAHAPAFNRWQSAKALSITFVLVVVFLFFEQLPRHGVALACAGVLLLSRRMASREMLGYVDWQLLVLFIGLFIVNGAFARTGAMETTLAARRRRRDDPTGLAVRAQRRPVEPGLQRACNHAAPARRDPSDGWAHPRAIEHAGRKPLHRGLDSQHHRRDLGQALRGGDWLPQARQDGRACHVGHPRDRGVVARDIVPMCCSLEMKVAKHGEGDQGCPHWVRTDLSDQNRERACGVIGRAARLSGYRVMLLSLVIV